MNCDDFMLHVAKEEADSPDMAEHLAECEACRELQVLLTTNEDVQSGQRMADEEIIGKTIGPYTVTKLLGAGGMGRVYLAVHPDIASRVAIKVFSRDWNLNVALVARFFAEARATNLIGHENIVNVLDVGRLEDGRPYMVMEHLPGCPLSSLIGTKELSDSLAVSLMLDVLSALSAAHEHKIVHRDLKPDNIFVSPEGRATLLDFGVAKLVPEAVAGAAPTATGTVLGTPQYMSPEQATGDPVDTRSDVYAMGIILYECFLGRRPFDGGTVYQLMDQHVNEMPPKPRELRPSISQGIEDVILKALAKSPSRRFASPAEMHEALAACEIGEAGGAFSMPPLGSSETALTLPNRPSAQRKEDQVARIGESDSPRAGRRKVVFAGLLLAGAAAALFVTMGAEREQEAAPKLALQRAVADASSLSPVPVQLPALDASAPDAAGADASTHKVVVRTPKKEPKRKPKKELRGIAPLSLLPEATELAIQRSPDAVLHRIAISWMDQEGRIDFSQDKREVVFDFLSSNLALKHAGKKRGHCLERITYTASSSPKRTRVTAECATARILPVPRCSMKKVFASGRSQNTFPPDLMASRALLRVSPKSTTGRATWAIEFGHRRFKVLAC